METSAASIQARLALDDDTLFAGGRLCLDFVNTACQSRGTPLEFLGDVEALARWLRSAARVHGDRLESLGDREPHVDETSLARAHALRDALRDLVQSVLDGRPAPEKAQETVNAVLRASPTVMRLDFADGVFRRSMRAVETEDAWLADIARDAVDFLCQSEPSLLRKCGCETCVRVFYDTTKNHKRRWCVEKCGSRVKAANYYRRKRAGRENAAP